MPLITFQTTGVFTGYTLAEMRALTLRHLRAADTSRYSPTQGAADYDWIDDAINRGQDDFVRQTKCLRTFAIIELLATWRTYRLPEDFLDLMAVYFYHDSLSNGYKELPIKTIEEMNDDSSDYRTANGTPEKVYLDRQYGAASLIGVAPIPDTSGDTVTIDSAYGAAVEWICPIYTFSQDIGVVIRATGSDEWILPTANGVSVSIELTNGNLLVEYYRLPQTMTDATGRSEVPREYQKALTYYAAADLLSDNPEDSAEYRRSNEFLAKFNNEIGVYINKRKRALSGRELRARAMVWNWNMNMPYYKGLK